MRRRPPQSPISPALLKQAEQRSDDLIDEVALALRDSDPLDADFGVRLLALEQAAIRAAGAAPELQMAALAAAKEAAERAEAEAGHDLRARVRAGQWIVGQVARAFHTPSPPTRVH